MCLLVHATSFLIKWNLAQCTRHKDADHEGYVCPFYVEK